MANNWGWQLRLTAVAAAYAAVLQPAFAQEAGKAIDGNGWIAIAIILGLVALIVLIIRGTFSISGRDQPDRDDAGVGVLEGIDDDDEDKPRKRH